MIRRILVWTSIAAAVAVAGFAVHLLTEPDPGPYLVALRSDTPEQVEHALNAILAGDTIILYEGSTYPPAANEDIERLGWRYYHKATGQSHEPLKGDTALWMRFADRAAAKIRSRSGN